MAETSLTARVIVEWVDRGRVVRRTTHAVPVDPAGPIQVEVRDPFSGDDPAKHRYSISQVRGLLSISDCLEAGYLPEKEKLLSRLSVPVFESRPPNLARFLWADLSRAIAALSPRDQRMIAAYRATLGEMDGRRRGSTHEAARRLGIPQRTFWDRLRATARQIADYLNGTHEEQSHDCSSCGI